MGLASITGTRLTALLAVTALAATAGCRKSAPPTPASVTFPADAGRPAARAVPAPSPPPRGLDLALLYSSNLQGHAMPCDCVRPLGGLARRATVIARARAEADATLVVDAGDLFDGTESTTVARRLAAAMTAGGLDAFTPGERDLALGPAALKRLATARALPILSSNLTDQAGHPLFGGERLFTLGGVRVGVFGVSAPPTPADAARWQAAGVLAAPPEAAARDAIASLRRQGAQVVVGLFHVGLPAEARRLATGLPGLDWAVLGHSALNLEAPEKAGNARLLEAFAEGKNLGRLDLHVVGGSVSFADAHERAELEAILADHRRQLGDYDHSLGGMDPAALEDYYRQRRLQLQTAIARETAALSHLPRAVAGSWFENRIIPLDAAIPDDPRVSGLVRRLGPHL